VKQPDIYCYLSDTGTYIKINDEIDDERFLISECSIKDAVVLICQSGIKIFDTLKRRIIEHVQIDIDDLNNYSLGHAYYYHKNNVVCFGLLVENEWRYYKLNLSLTA